MWRRLTGLIFLSAVSALGAQPLDTDRILSAAEIATLDQENALWRRVRPEEDAATNLQTLRAAGFPETLLKEIEPRLTALWDVPNERNFGWLTDGTVQQIQAVDREFVGRMRATRLFEATGIRLGAKGPEKTATINREWRQAILHVLNYDEIAEYQLANSRSAQETNRCIKDLVLTTDERRTLYEWQREFDGTQGQPAGAALHGDRSRRWRMEAQLDHWKRIRELLGDGRFVVYLSRASFGFDKMKEAVGQGEGVTATLTLDLWWLRQGYVLAQEKKLSGKEVADLQSEARAKATALLGEAQFAVYTQDEDARWLQPRQARSRKKGP